MRRYVTTNYYDVRCNCEPFISPAVPLRAIYTSAWRYRSMILRGISLGIARARDTSLNARLGVTYFPCCERIVYNSECRRTRWYQIKYNCARSGLHIQLQGVKNTPPDLDVTLCKTTYPRKLYTTPSVFFSEQQKVMAAINEQQRNKQRIGYSFRL